jgi:hypothetical protein
MMNTIMIITTIIVKMIIMKGQSYARIKSISHLLSIFVSTANITTLIHTMIIKIRNKPQGLLPSSDPDRNQY